MINGALVHHFGLFELQVHGVKLIRMINPHLEDTLLLLFTLFRKLGIQLLLTLKIRVHPAE